MNAQRAKRCRWLARLLAQPTVFLVLGFWNIGFSRFEHHDAIPDICRLVSSRDDTRRATPLLAPIDVGVVSQKRRRRPRGFRRQPEWSALFFAESM